MRLKVWCSDRSTAYSAFLAPVSINAHCATSWRHLFQSSPLPLRAIAWAYLHIYTARTQSILHNSTEKAVGGGTSTAVTFSLINTNHRIFRRRSFAGWSYFPMRGRKYSMTTDAIRNSSQACLCRGKGQVAELNRITRHRLTIGALMRYRIYMTSV